MDRKGRDHDGRVFQYLRSHYHCHSLVGKLFCCLNFSFFFTTRIDLSEQQFKLTLVPSGDEQVVEAGSTVTVTCILADYLILPELSNLTWTAENSRNIQV